MELPHKVTFIDAFLKKLILLFNQISTRIYLPQKLILFKFQFRLQGKKSVDFSMALKSIKQIKNFIKNAKFFI